MGRKLTADIHLDSICHNYQAARSLIPPGWPWPKPMRTDMVQRLWQKHSPSTPMHLPLRVLKKHWNFVT